MKTIQPPNAEWTPWWLGLLVECNVCGSAYELERDDQFYQAISIDSERQQGVLQCPRCLETTVFKSQPPDSERREASQNAQNEARHE